MKITDLKVYLTRPKSSTRSWLFVEIETDKGHDAFLLNEPEFHNILNGFVNGLKKKVEI